MAVKLLESVIGLTAEYSVLDSDISLIWRAKATGLERPSLVWDSP